MQNARLPPAVPDPVGRWPNDPAGVALRVSESRYRRLFETALDGILLLNADTAQIEDVNPYLIGMLGYTHAEFLGKKLWEVGAFADVAQSKAMFGELQSNGYVRYDDMPLKTKAGKPLEVEFVSNTYFCEGIEVIQCNIRDITERKMAQAELALLNAELERRVARRTAELERANSELDAFSYSVAHDLRAPLRTIIGFSSIVAETNRDRLDADSINHLHRIHAGAQRMAALIDDLLDLAHISRQVPHREQFNLSDLVQRVAEPLLQAQAGRQVQFTVRPDMVTRADPRLVRIALVNLLDNAWKFTARTAEARIEVGKDERNGEIVFFVRDNGAGFDMRHAGKLFEPFQRMHGQEDYGGTGIGLSIVERIVSRHGGRVWAEGAVGKGATIFFTFGKLH
jgi:PAS domain S-box-containing protein